ncbi:MAG: hypothetical protein ABIP55_08605 [Tepidisphaeraceae bacterium]
MATAIGVIGAAGVGAAVMYLLDPNQGSDRRHHLVDLAGNALESTSEAVRSGLHTVGHHAAGTGAAIAAQVPSAQDVSDMGRLAWQRAGDAADSTRHAAGDWLHSARNMLPSHLLPRRVQPRRESMISPTVAGLGGLAALAIGVGAMWLLDPSRGRGRRAWIGQKTSRALSETGQFMRATGRHLRNKTKGYYHNTRAVAEDWMGHSGSVEPESSAQLPVEPREGGAPIFGMQSGSAI